jgi:hypothetical protein
MLPLYDPDTKQKWDTIFSLLNTSQYMVITSNRLYGSISSAPEKYPITSKYYELLFRGDLGYERIAEFTSRPTLPVPFIHLCITPPGISYGKVAQTQECSTEGISITDDYADETWTVYDHPKVTIFKRTRYVDMRSLLSL